MNIDSRLYVSICPVEGDRSPVPHPVRHARLSTDRLYKVLGMYNASETSECLLILSNDDGELWFISNRHLRAAGLFDGDALSRPMVNATNDRLSESRDDTDGVASLLVTRMRV